MSNIIEYKGKLYKSTVELCQEFNVPLRTFRDRLRRGYTIEDAITKPIQSKVVYVKHTNKPRSIVAPDGKVFDSVNSFCTEYGLKRQSFMMYFNKGWKIEDILQHLKELQDKQDNIYDHKGVKYSTLKEMCDTYEISTSNYRARLNRGMTKEEALTKRTEVEDHLGQKFPTQAAMCRHHGVSKETFTIRRLRGCTIEECLYNGQLKHKYQRVEIDDPFGKHWKGVIEMCKYYGIDYSTYKQRMLHGWTMEDALTKSVDTTKTPHKV